MLKEKMEITQEVLRDRYDYYDGHLYNRRQLNSRALEDERAGTIKLDGRILIMIKRKRYYEHRLIYLYHHGIMPIEIDHADGDRTNNHIENLREASRSQNMANSRVQKDNSSGYKGVSYDTAKFLKRSWHARININGIGTFLGYFATAEEAARAYDAAAIEAYGEFAKTNESLGLFERGEKC